MKYGRLLTVLGVFACPGFSEAQSVQDLMNEALKNPAVRDAMKGRVPSVPRSRGRDDVREIQRLLNARGFSAGTPDGIAGAGTRRAISAFQASVGRPQTGQITPEELTILRAGPEPASKPTTSKPKPLDMSELQSLLTDLDYDPGPIDGAWGRRSQQALEQFRQDENSGTAGPPNAEDMEHLRAAVKPGAEGAEPGAPILYALPIVDRGSAFSVAWKNAPDRVSIAIVPLRSDDVPNERVSGPAPLRLSAPAQAGLYHIVMIPENAGSISARFKLEVR